MKKSELTLLALLTSSNAVFAQDDAIRSEYETQVSDEARSPDLKEQEQRAHDAMQQRQDRAAVQRALHKVRRASGDVVAVKSVDVRGANLKDDVAVLKTTKTGRLLHVDLGPSDALGDAGIKPGAKIQVEGTVAKVGDHVILVSRKLKVGGRELNVDRARQIAHAKAAFRDVVERAQTAAQTAVETRRADPMGLFLASSQGAEIGATAGRGAGTPLGNEIRADIAEHVGSDVIAHGRVDKVGAGGKAFTVKAGDQSIPVVDASGWKVGRLQPGTQVHARGQIQNFTSLIDARKLGLELSDQQLRQYLNKPVIIAGAVY